MSNIFAIQNRNLNGAKSHACLRACLKIVASAILADVEPRLPARRNRVAMKKIIVTMKRFNLRAILPGGKMPPSTAGRDARRHIFRHALKPSSSGLLLTRVFIRSETQPRHFNTGISQKMAGHSPCECLARLSEYNLPGFTESSSSWFCKRRSFRLHCNSYTISSGRRRT